MSTNEKDKLFNAYLDGELAVAESVSFDELFSPSEKERIGSELKLEAAINELLCGDVACPDLLWKRTEALISAQSAKQRTRVFPYLRAAFGAVAALVIFVVGAFLLNQGAPQNDLFSVSAATIEDFEAMAEVKGDHDTLCAYLKEQGLDLTLDTVENASLHTPHKMRILGLCKGDCDGEEVQQVLVSCCEFPTKIIIAQAGSPAAKMMDMMKAKGVVIETRQIGNSYACVVGSHAPTDALNFLIEAH